MATDQELETLEELKRVFKSEIPSGKTIATAAVRHVLRNKKASPEWVKKNFSALVESIQEDAYSRYLLAERSAWEKAFAAAFGPLHGECNTPKEVADLISDNFYALDRFFLTLTQGRRVRAVQEVFECTGESISYREGVLSSSPDVLNRITTRAGVTKYELKPPAYTDRKGDIQLPFDQALELAQSFCRTEPVTVLTEVESTERQYCSEASRPGEEYMIPLLNSYRAAWALLRQWCHNDAFTAAREKEINTLVRLLWDAIYALQKAGADDEADRLRHVLERG